MSELPSTKDFSNALNTTFNMTFENTDLTLELTEISVSEMFGKEGKGYENISMIFCGKKELPQASYTISHDSLGSQTLFLVPVGTKEDNFEYEVIINRQK